MYYDRETFLFDTRAISNKHKVFKKISKFPPKSGKLTKILPWVSSSKIFLTTILMDPNTACYRPTVTHILSQLKKSKYYNHKRKKHDLAILWLSFIFIIFGLIAIVILVSYISPQLTIIFLMTGICILMVLLILFLYTQRKIKNQFVLKREKDFQKILFQNNMRYFSGSGVNLRCGSLSAYLIFDLYEGNIFRGKNPFARNFNYPQNNFQRGYAALPYITNRSNQYKENYYTPIIPMYDNLGPQFYQGGIGFPINR